MTSYCGGLLATHALLYWNAGHDLRSGDAWRGHAALHQLVVAGCERVARLACRRTVNPVIEGEVLRFPRGRVPCSVDVGGVPVIWPEGA